MENKIKLFYIASNGRSGSTLLDMLVGKHNKCYTLGEFQMLPNDWKYNLQPCGCGKEVKNCEFWQKIISNHKSIIEKGTISLFRDINKGKVLRWNELFKIFFNFKENKDITKQYGQDNYIIMQEVLKNMNENIEYLVDASKDPYRMKYLIQSGYFDLWTLHIIKEPWAFVYSMQKKEKNILKKYYLTIRMSIRWVVENYIIYKISQKYNKYKYIKIRYEGLASNPNYELNKVFNKVNMQWSEEFIKDGFKHQNHAISGNFMRFKNPEIKLDEKWKTNLSNTQKLIISFITKPFYKTLYK